METKTIARAEPSVAPPPMVKHLIERKRDPEQKFGPFHPDQYEDKALCGYVWDRLLDLRPNAPTCEECKAEARRRAQ